MVCLFFDQVKKVWKSFQVNGQPLRCNQPFMLSQPAFTCSKLTDNYAKENIDVNKYFPDNAQDLFNV